MSDTASTVVDAPLCGRRRRFQLRLGEIAELERLAKAGIGEIALRLATHRFTSADIFDTIRLGLAGGGETEAGSSAIVMTLEGQPMAPYVGLAAQIVDACINGVPQDSGVKKAEAEGQRESPATSPPSTERAQ